MDHLVVGAFTPSVLLSVARRTGRLEEQELLVDEVPVTSSPAQFRSLLAGELDVALTSPDNVLAYRFDPGNPLRTVADVRILSTVDRGMGLGLYGRPGLEPADVAGAQPRFGVDVATSGFALAMYALVESLGADRDSLDLVALGSTPRRLAALQDGRCDATMLNAGNELLAESAGCPLLAGVASVCGAYVGTVLCVHGDRHVAPAHRLARALRRTASDICSGNSAGTAREEAAARLQLPEPLAERYVERLKNPTEGLITDERPDLAGLRTVLDLRRRYLPPAVASGDDAAHGADWAVGVEGLEGALDEASGLICTEDPPG